MAHPNNKSHLGPQIFLDLLTLYAFFGCDTTSAVYSIGKTARLKTYKDNDAFRQNVSSVQKMQQPMRFTLLVNPLWLWLTKVQELSGNSLDPKHWGRIMLKGHYEPKSSDLPQGPAEILKAIKCSCTAYNCTGEKC